MKIHLLAVGTRMPGWVKTGYAEYGTRLPRECALNLLEIPAGKRGPNAGVARIVRDEGERLLAAVPPGSRLIALDERGLQWNTAELADRLWSLSRLTLPHPLVRVVVAEQIYRAWSLLQHHPYHRA